MEKCTVEGCQRAQKARGMCTGHYSRWRTYGDDFDRSALIEYGAPLRFLETLLSIRPSGCVFWPYARITAGYGTVTVDGKTQLVHRLVCERVHGPPPTPEHEAAHNCGQGHMGCIGPACLRWATRKSNLADCVAHDTDNRGERHYATHLTESDVREIRELRRGGATYQSLADWYDVSVGAVGHIIRMSTWKHVA